MRALVFANGQPPSLQLMRDLARGAGLLVAADGGAGYAVAAGLTVQHVVGDLDSVSAAIRDALPPGAVHRDPDPDHTDLEKAVAFCVARGYSEIDVVAAGGGRADHALANLSIPILFRGRARVRLIDDEFEISLVEGSATIDRPAGTIVSLIAAAPCAGVTTTGLRWDLDDHSLAFSPYGVHNEVARRPATVSVRSGDLLLFAGRRVEKHA